MEYKEILDSARPCIGPYCKACPVCNGKACGNQVPGPGAKAPGSGFIRNFDAWQKICVNMDTICPNEPVDTAVDLFGTMYRYPFFAAPLGAMKLHYGEKYTDREYNSILVNACADSGIAASERFAVGCFKSRRGFLGLPAALRQKYRALKDPKNAGDDRQNKKNKCEVHGLKWVRASMPDCVLVCI